MLRLIYGMSATINLYKFLFALFIFLGMFLYVSAHGDSPSFEIEVDNFTVGVGYTPEIIFVGTPVRFDFSLFENGDPRSFSSVWVRVFQDRNVVFAGPINKAPIGETGILLQFPDKGEYTVSVRYEEEDQTLVSASFPLEIQKEDADGIDVFPFILLLGGFFFGIIGGILIRRKYK